MGELINSYVPPKKSWNTMLMLLRFLGNSPWSTFYDTMEILRFQAVNSGFFTFFNLLTGGGN